MAHPRRAATAALALLAIVTVAVVLIMGPGDERAPRRRAVVTIVQDDAELLHRSPRRIAATLDDLQGLGADWVRVTAGWSVIAPDPASTRRPEFDARDPDAYPVGAWRALDRLARMARARGLRLNVDIAFFAPRWAVARDAADPQRQRDGIDAFAFADFAEAVARRYPSAAAFTVWNEPNHPVFLLPQWRRAGGSWQAASPDVYRAMVRAAVPRIRSAAPRSRVLIGATSSVGSPAGDDRDDRMAPLTFLRALACVDARLRPLRTPSCEHFEPLPGDGWSHHPYSLELAPWQRDPHPENVRMGDLARMSSTLDALHRAGRTRRRLGLYLTESGYQTNPPDPTWEVGTGDQARWLPEGERVARADPLVRSVAQFLVRDLPERPGATATQRWRDYQSGLRFADGSPKPSHESFRLALVARRAGRRRVALWGLVRPGTRRRRARVVVRDGDGAGAQAAWRPLADVLTASDGSFSTTVSADPASSFRLSSGGAAGTVVRGAR